jgi:hypothetical protein
MRRLSIALVVLLLLSVSACGKTKDSASAPASPEAAAIEAPTPTNTGSQGITTDENLLTVDITLPVFFFQNEDMATFAPDAYAKEQGFKKAVMNDDGSVTVTMTKAKHKEMLKEMETTCEEGFADLVEGESTPYVKAISHTDGFDTITVDVDRAGYEAAVIDLTPFAVGFSGMMYQSFVEGEIRVEVIVRDVDTGETIGTTVYPDDMGGM